jgi:hypothetical protein
MYVCLFVGIRIPLSGITKKIKETSEADFLVQAGKINIVVD